MDRLLPRAFAALALIGCLAASAPSAAENLRAPKFRLLDQKQAQRLRWKTRLAIDSVAEVLSASGFIVHQDQQTGHALLLTNEHVVRGGVTAGAPVKFFDGAQGRTVRLISSNPKLDYALIEIENPIGPTRPGLTLDATPMAPGSKIFSLAAYANLFFKKPWLALAGGAAANQLVLNGPANRWALARGRMSVTDPNLQTITTGITDAVTGNKITTLITGRIAVLPNAPGMSGSPVFSHATQDVVALHSSGGHTPEPEWEESSVPMALILDNLHQQHAANAYDAQAMHLIGGLLKKPALP